MNFSDKVKFIVIAVFEDKDYGYNLFKLKWFYKVIGYYLFFIKLFGREGSGYVKCFRFYVKLLF